MNKKTRHHNRTVPRVSILTPVINVEEYIRETIDTVRAQTFPHWEMIIMDGDSTDNTVRIAKEYERIDSRIRVFSEPDEGPLHAFEKALSRARGEFIYLLCGQDGFLDNDWLKKCMEVLERDPEVALVWGLTRGMSRDGVLADSIDRAYSHFVAPERVVQSVWNIFKRVRILVRDLLLGEKERRTVLFEKLFSPSARLRINLFTKRKFSHGGAPQKKEWIRYWLDTGLPFLDQTMCIARSVFLNCTPRYELGSKRFDYLGDFFFNFNTRGYLPYFIPSVATFGRAHPGQSGERRGVEVHQQLMDYLERTAKFRKNILKKKEPFQFRNRHGVVIESRVLE